METRPIAGTRPRGKTPEEDLALEAELLADEKERAEHLMLVDLGRNDIGRVSEFGTVKCDSFMEIERYSHVMHIVSNVSGKLREDKDFFDAFLSCMPAGTVSGAPKLRAMEIIAELENEAAALMREQSDIWASAGTWIPVLRFVRLFSRMAKRMCKPEPELYGILFRRTNMRKRSIRLRRC